MTEEEKEEFEYNVNSLSECIYEAIMGADKLESRSIQWQDIIREAAEKCIRDYSNLENYRD